MQWIIRIDPEAELRGYDDLLTHRRERIADQFLIGVGPINLCRTEESDAAFDRGTDQRQRPSLFGRLAIAVA